MSKTEARGREGKLKGRETNLWRKRGGVGQYHTRNGPAILAFKAALRIELAKVQKEASWRHFVGSFIQRLYCSWWPEVAVGEVGVTTEGEGARG